MKDNISKPDFAVIAADMARRGFHAFPLGVNSKVPDIKRFPTRATDDPARIATWAKNGPHRNLGVSTTMSAHGPLFVVDVDDKDGRTGSATILELEMAGFILPPTFTVRTVSGGLHYYFTVPAPMKQGTDVLGSGVDTRSKGGYCVGPGSIVNGGVYQIERDLPVAAAPQWLLDRVQRAPEGEPKASEKLDGIDADRARRRAIDWLENGAPAGTAGNRNDTAYKVAAKLKDLGNDPDVILELMEDYWNCSPPADEGTLEKIIANVFKHGQNAQGSDAPEAVFPDDEVSQRAQEEAERKAAGEDEESAGDDDAGGDEWDKATAAGKKGRAKERRTKYFFDGETPPAPPKQLIKRLLNSTGVAIIGGQSGAGKTFISIEMAVALASGQTFFGHKVKERVGVAIVAYEGAGSIHLRINAAREARGIDAALPIVWTRGDADLRSKEAMANLAEDMKTLGAEMQERLGVRLGVIIIDTLGRAFSMNDENDNAEANAIIGALDRLSIETGAAAVAVHHYGKTEAVGLRGASAWRGGADTVLSVLAERNETTGTVSNRRLALAKSRDDEEGPLSGFELVEVRVGVDEDLESITTCHVSPRAARHDESGPKATRAEATLLRVFDDLREAGETIKAATGEDVAAVDQTLLRERFMDEWPADGDTEANRAAARRKAFSRALAGLVEKKWLATREIDGRSMTWRPV